LRGTASGSDTPGIGGWSCQRRRVTPSHIRYGLLPLKRSVDEKPEVDRRQEPFRASECTRLIADLNLLELMRLLLEIKQ
jgi:hypothetical protein